LRRKVFAVPRHGQIPGNTPPFKQLPTEAAYRAVTPELLALDGAPLTPVNIDVVAAVMTVLGAVPQIRTLRPAVKKELPNFDLSNFDKLEQYALALGHAHALYRNAVAPNANMAAQAAHLTVLRDRMYQAALALAEFGLVNAERLEECKTTIGYRALSNDVLTLVAIYKEHWSEVAQKTPVTATLLDEAGTRAVELLESVSLKEQAQLTAPEAALQRTRAFTLLTRTYDNVRRAVAYLRAVQGDLEKVAPSLYAGRRGRPRGDDPPRHGAAPAPAGHASVPNTPSKPEPSKMVMDARAGLTSFLTH
jgi:hypothetical protein